MPKKVMALVLAGAAVIAIPFRLVYGRSDPVEGCYSVRYISTDGVAFLRYTKSGIYWYTEENAPPTYLGCYYHHASRGWIQQLTDGHECTLSPSPLGLEGTAPDGGASWKEDWYLDVLGAKRLIEDKQRKLHGP